MANRRKIRDGDELARQIDEFVNWCEEYNEIPSDYNFAKYLDISDYQLQKMYQGGGEPIVDRAGRFKRDVQYNSFPEALKKLSTYREHRLLIQMESNPKMVTSAIFQLKQAKNGGYTDSPLDNSGGATITLKIEGVGGAEAFL
jgi:hypothetical protein